MDRSTFHQRIKTDPEFRKKMDRVTGDTLRKLHSEGKIKYDTYGMLGKSHTEKSKNQMSQSKRGKDNPQFGKMWITDGVSNKMMKSSEEIPSGWSRGRI